MSETPSPQSLHPNTWLTNLRKKKISRIDMDGSNPEENADQVSQQDEATPEANAGQASQQSETAPQAEDTVESSSPSLEMQLGRSAKDLATQANEIVAAKETEQKGLHKDVKLAYQALGGLEDLAPSLMEENGMKIPGVETLGSKVSKEMALQILLEATKVVLDELEEERKPDINNASTKSAMEKGLQFCKDNEDIWKLLPSHQQIWVQLNFEKTVRGFWQRVPGVGSIDSIRNVSEAITAKDSMEDAFQNIIRETEDSLRKTYSDRLDQPEEAVAKQNLEKLLEKNKGDISILIAHLDKHVNSLEKVLTRLPNSELKSYLTSVLEGIQSRMEGLDGDDDKKKRKAAMEVIHFASEKLTYIGTMINVDDEDDRDFRGSTPFSQKLRQDLPGGAIATTFWEGFKLKNKVGRASAEVAKSGWKKGTDVRGFASGERGEAMVAEKTPNTYRSAERQSIHIAERVAELMQTLNSLKEMDLNSSENVNSKQVLDAAKEMQKLRRALPLLEQIQTIAETGDLTSVMGVMATEISKEVTDNLVNTAREFFPQGSESAADSAETESALETEGILGQELLVKTVVDRIVTLYDVSEEDAMAMIKADESGIKDWYKRRENEGQEKRGIRGIHKRMVSGLRRNSVDNTKIRLSPAEQMGVSFDGENIVLSEAAQSMAGALERLSKLTGPEASLEGMEPEQLRKDLALVNHLVMKAGDASFSKKLRELVRGEAVLTSLKTMGIADKAQAFIENGAVLAAEAGAAIGIGLLASQAGEVAEYVTEQLHNATGSWLSHAQGELTATAGKLANTIADFDAPHVIEDARDSVENTLEWTRNAMYEVNIAFNKLNVGVDNLQEGIADSADKAVGIANSLAAKLDSLDISTNFGKGLLAAGTAASLATTEALVRSKPYQIAVNTMKRRRKIKKWDKLARRG